MRMDIFRVLVILFDVFKLLSQYIRNPSNRHNVSVLLPFLYLWTNQLDGPNQRMNCNCNHSVSSVLRILELHNNFCQPFFFGLTTNSICCFFKNLRKHDSYACFALIKGYVSRNLTIRRIVCLITYILNIPAYLQRLCILVSIVLIGRISAMPTDWCIVTDHRQTYRKKFSVPRTRYLRLN